VHPCERDVGRVNEGDLTYTVVTSSVLQYMNLSSKLAAAKIPQNYASVIEAINTSALSCI